MANSVVFLEKGFIYETYGIMQKRRPIIIPFGPKIFALVSMLVAYMHHPSVAVWRVSSGRGLHPEDKTSSGVVVGLKTIFKPA